MVDRGVTAAIVVALIVLLQLLTTRGVISQVVVASPSDVWNALRDGIASGRYPDAIVSTASAMFIGFGIAGAVAIGIAAVLVSSERLERITMPIVVAFQSLPKVALAPLVILWLGFGASGKITLVAISAFFPILVNSLDGLRLRHAEQYQLMQSLGASKWQVLRYIRVPNAVPSIFAGLHVGILLALIGAVVAEFVGSASGVGYQLVADKANFNVPGMYAILVILMVWGVLLHAVMSLLEKRIAFWAADVTRATV